MIRRLCSEFHLAESLVCCLCRLFDCLCQKFCVMKWEQEQVARNPPSFTRRIARRLISRYPLMAFFTELLDFVNAGGSSTTTSNFSPFSSSSGRSSKTSSQRNFTVPSRPFRLAFLLACRTAVSDASTPRTLCAPAIPAFRQKSRYV